MAMLVSLQQASDHLRRDTTDDDADLTIKIQAASAAIMDYLGGDVIPLLSTGEPEEDSIAERQCSISPAHCYGTSYDNCRIQVREVGEHTGEDSGQVIPHQRLPHVGQEKEGSGSDPSRRSREEDGEDSRDQPGDEQGNGQKEEDGVEVPASGQGGNMSGCRLSYPRKPQPSRCT